MLSQGIHNSFSNMYIIKNACDDGRGKIENHNEPNEEIRNLNIGTKSPTPQKKKKKKKNLSVCYKLINRAMKYKEYCTNTNIEIHRTRETQIYVVHSIWDMSTDKQPILPFILSSEMKRYNLQKIHCNFFFSLTQCPLSLSLRIVIHNRNTIPSYK